jgi:hypothetical protein
MFTRGSKEDSSESNILSSNFILGICVLADMIFERNYQSTSLFVCSCNLTEAVTLARAKWIPSGMLIYR